MAYVRKKGNQLVIVHGTRDAESKQVQQETLFVIYSKAEARAAVGQSLHWFRHSLEKENPSIRFDWKKIDAAINEQMDVLPDIYAYKKDRVEGRFREAVVDFTRELLVANPQTLMSSSRLLQDQKYELEYLRDLIDWRLRFPDQEENEWNKDDSFYWGTLMYRRDVPAEGMERLHTLYYEGEHDKAEALAGLLTESWSNYAEGYSYLGLISMDRGELSEAAAHFDKAMEVGRTLFAKRIPKSDYWSDHSTRPYIRALTYAAQAHNRMEDYSTALDLCDRLENECHQDLSAAAERIPIFLNMDAWNQAARAARYVHGIYYDKNIPLAFALYELGDEAGARAHFLHGTIRYPRMAQMLCGKGRMKEPESDTEAQDHNHGVDALVDLETYLENRSVETRRFFKDILNRSEVIALIDEAQLAQKKWSEDREADRKWFDRVREMESVEFAAMKAAEIWAEA